ncbi:MAG TPA: hypothetical protein VFS43_11375 [Polyangiaceae bacterium]|nr:hypothetical protein [Polyangiaceae bacterium]
MRKTAFLHRSRSGLPPAMARDLPRADLGGQSGGGSAGFAANAPPRAGDAPAELAPVGVASRRGASCDRPGATGPEPEARGPDERASDPAGRPPSPRPSPKRRGAKAAFAAPCPCLLCCQHPGHPDEGYHRDLRSLLARLGEPQRRWVAALEARRLGFGGTRIVARITGLDEKTVRRGRRELDSAFAGVPERRLRRAAAGRRRAGG